MTSKKIVWNILILSLIAVSCFAMVFVLPRFTQYHIPIPAHLAEIFKKKNANPDSLTGDRELAKIKVQANILKKYAKDHNYSRQYCFIADMQQHSGRKRFYVYDFLKNSIAAAGLVAHGNCNEIFLAAPKFSNIAECGCSSIGKYKIGGLYKGRFGNAYKLYGLDTSNSNAYDRSIVLHGYDCVPDKECYPQPICNSLGCAMVSYHFFQTLSGYVAKSKKPVVLWVLK